MSSDTEKSRKPVALITGAAGGIGRGLAQVFGRAGYVVALNDVSTEPLNAFYNGLRDDGIAGGVYPADVSDPGAVRDIVASIESELGPVGVLLNNAAVFCSSPLSDITDEEWDRVQAVNVKGALHCAQSVVPYMVSRSGGVIINIVSLAGKRGRTIFGRPGESIWAAYAVSKASLSALTYAMAYEWAPLKIRVNAVAPGPVLTGFHDEEKSKHASEVPVGRIGTPEDVAQAALFLASPEATFIQGEVLDVNGGLEMD